jgi:hypothetical protein
MITNRTVIRNIGLVCLVLASLSRWFFPLADAITGVLYGITIASLLMSLRRPSHCVTS